MALLQVARSQGDSCLEALSLARWGLAQREPSRSFLETSKNMLLDALQKLPKNPRKNLEEKVQLRLALAHVLLRLGEGPPGGEAKGSWREDWGNLEEGLGLKDPGLNPLEKAARFLRNCLEVSRGEEGDTGEAIYAPLLASSLLRLGHLDEAKSTLRAALEKRNSAGERPPERKLVRVLCQLAACHWRIGEAELARGYLERVRKALEGGGEGIKGDKVLLADVLWALGRVCASMVRSFSSPFFCPQNPLRITLKISKVLP